MIIRGGTSDPIVFGVNSFRIPPPPTPGWPYLLFYFLFSPHLIRYFIFLIHIFTFCTARLPILGDYCTMHEWRVFRTFERDRESLLWFYVWSDYWLRKRKKKSIMRLNWIKSNELMLKYEILLYRRSGFYMRHGTFEPIFLKIWYVFWVWFLLSGRMWYVSKKRRIKYVM